MMSMAPASCSPWAMDQAMLRLLATPNTTATRPSRLKDIRPPRKVLRERKKDTSGLEDAPLGDRVEPALSGRAAWGLARVGGRRACFASAKGRTQVICGSFAGCGRNCEKLEVPFF